MNVLDTMDLIEIHGKILDLYCIAKDFQDKKTGKPQFTKRTRLLIHQIAVMCHRSPVLNQYEQNGRRLAYMEKRTPEQILVDMVFAVSEGADKQDKLLQYITPMLCIPMIDELLRKREKEGEE